jgi:phospholipid/cholesterol/gamma-HCH transport system substrate-binding protein
LKISREFKVGIIALFALVVLYWGFHFLKGSNIFDDKRYFYAEYQSIDGLSPAKPVTINGLKVGQVSEIYFHPDGSGSIMVKIALTSNFQISTDTKARIYSSSIMGDKAVSLDLGKSGIEAESGDTLISDIELSISAEVNKQVAPLKEKAEKLIGSIDTVMVLASGFLTTDNKANFAKTFESIRRSFATLEHSVTVFDQTLNKSQEGLVETVGNVASVTKTFKDNEEKLNSIFTNLDAVGDSLSKIEFKKTFAALESTLEDTKQVMQKINEGQGTAGKLVNDTQVYDNLNKATEQLNLLLLDLKYNPKRYINFSVFGNSKEFSEEEIKEMEAEKAKSR